MLYSLNLQSGRYFTLLLRHRSNRPAVPANVLMHCNALIVRLATLMAFSHAEPPMRTIPYRGLKKTFARWFAFGMLCGAIAGACLAERLPLLPA